MDDPVIKMLQIEYTHYIKYLIHQNVLNHEFDQIQKLQVDGDDPKYMADIVQLYLDETQKQLKIMATILGQKNVDYFEMLRKPLIRLLGSSAQIGAEAVRKVCEDSLNCCKEKNMEGCLRCMKRGGDAYNMVRSAFVTILEMEQNIVAAGGSIPKPPEEKPYQMINGASDFR